MNLGLIFKELLTAAKNDAEAILLPLVGNAATSIAANPTEVNAASAGLNLLAGAIAAGPTVGQEILQALASEVNASVAAAIAKIPKAATPPTPK
jgi:hypothetical protein